MPPSLQVPFWRRTPPAVFPPVMGLFGLGLAWRRATEAFGVPAALADLILGATSLLYLFLAASYLAKLIYRPRVVLEDLRILPGRAGLAAMTLSGLLLAAALAPVFPGAARGVLMLCLGLHVGLAALVILVLATGPSEQRQVTPAWHLSFVGFIVVPLSAVPLGMIGLSQAIMAITMVLALIIYGISLAQLTRRDPPPPLRPLLAIHLAPFSLFGTVALMLGHGTAALVLAGLATAILALLLVRVRYLTAAGFSPLWGAFTFPLAAYTGLMLALGATGAGAALAIPGAALLAAASLIIPGIAARTLRLWASGALALKTNAAIA